MADDPRNDFTYRVAKAAANSNAESHDEWFAFIINFVLEEAAKTIEDLPRPNTDTVWDYGHGYFNALMYSAEKLRSMKEKK